MVNTFIHPNWDVVLLDYPIALLTSGVVIELINLIRPRERFRSAGRWMILLGALLSFVTLSLGIYAYRDVVSTVPTEPNYKWSQVVERSPWNDQQWRLMTRHIWLNSIAVAIFLVVVALWLSGNDEWRKKFYALLLIALLVGVGLMTAGAWHGGEAVFRYGTAVNFDVLKSSQAVAEKTSETGRPLEPVVERLRGTAVTEQTKGINYYIPPLQLHIELAGFVIAVIIVALGISLRRMERAMNLAGSTGNPVSPGTSTGSVTSNPAAPGTIPTPEPTVPVSPSLLWLVALLIGLGTAVVGAWTVLGSFTATTLKADWEILGRSDYRRLLMHVITGVSIIVLVIALAIITKYFRRQYRLISIMIILVMVISALQMWSGVLMLYDSPSGPLLRFSVAEAKAETQTRQKSPPTPPATNPSTSPGQ